MIKTLANV